MNDWSIETLHPDFGAAITNVDLSGDIDSETAAGIHALIDQYSFLVFPNQARDDDFQLQFTLALGDAESSHIAKGEGKLEYFGTIGNVQEDGTVLGNAHKKTRFLTGNNIWHTDASFKPVPAMLSIMCAYETPDTGGNLVCQQSRRV